SRRTKESIMTARGAIAILPLVAASLALACGTDDTQIVPGSGRIHKGEATDTPASDAPAADASTLAPATPPDAGAASADTPDAAAATDASDAAREAEAAAPLAVFVTDLQYQ